MSLAHSPSISTDNLLIYLDAANAKSYPGTGTTWTNLSMNKTNATLTGGPVYSSTNGGELVFDGGDYATITYDPVAMDFSLAQTICMWIKPGTGANSSRRNPYNQAYAGPGTITHELNGAFNYFFGTNGSNGPAGTYVGRGSSFTVVAGEVAFISVTRDQATNSVKWFKNGVRVTSETASGYAATNNGTSPILIGSGYTTGFLGSIYNCAVYNRALTESEILQNFNALRGRYGL